MTTGAMRIKNEGRWIERCLRSLLACCDNVVILDDHSTDNTRDICKSFDRVAVYESPFNTLNEVIEKNYLLDLIRPSCPEWVIMIDGDEEIPAHCVEIIQRAKGVRSVALAFQVLYLWDSPDQIRTDGVYSRFWRPSMFRLTGHRFCVTNAAGGFHCGNVPIAQQRSAERLAGSSLLHFGYMHREDRLRKYEWYNAQDPGNASEDFYRHVVIGDMFPPDSRFRHAGPLKLAPLEVPCLAR